MRRGASLSIALAVAGCAEGASQTTLVVRAPIPVSGPSPAVGILAGADVAPILTERTPINLVRVLEMAGETPNIVRFAKQKVAEADAELHRRQADVILPTVRLVNELEVHEGAIQFQQTASFASTGRRDFLGIRVLKDWNIYADYQELTARARDRDADREQLGSVELTSVQDGAEAYFSLQESQAAVSIAREALARAKEFLGVAAAQERERLGLAVDRLKAESEVAKREEIELAAEETFRVASATLATFLRLDPTVLFFSDESAVRPVTFIPPNTNVDALIQSAYATRPDIREERDRVDARRHMLKGSQIGPFIPHIVAGLFGYGGGGLGFELQGPDTTDPRPRADYYVGVQWELVGAGLADYFHAQSDGAQLGTAVVQEQDKREHVARQIIEAHQAVRSRYLAIEAARRELAATEEAWTIALKRLEEGVGLAVDVLAANEARTTAATHLVNAISLYNKNQFRLLARMGERPDIRQLVEHAGPEPSPTPSAAQ
jgi:outer membrane protein TolC